MAIVAARIRMLQTLSFYEIRAIIMMKRKKEVKNSLERKDGERGGRREKKKERKSDMNVIGAENRMGKTISQPSHLRFPYCLRLAQSL